MRYLLLGSAALLLLTVTGSVVLAQQPDELANLRREVELLKKENDLLKKEFELLKKQAGGPKGGNGAVAGDPFCVGAVWTGRRTVNGTIKQDWQFKVTERKGEAFKGEIEFNRPDGTIDTYKVEGNAPAKGDGSMSFQAVKTGFFHQSFTGKVSGGQIALAFSGKGGDGSGVAGSATLKPKN